MVTTKQKPTVDTQKIYKREWNQSISLQKIIKSQSKAAGEEEMNKETTNWLEKN